MDERRNRYMCDCWPRGAADRVYGYVALFMYNDRFLILLRGRRNATRRAPKHFNGKAALGLYRARIDFRRQNHRTKRVKTFKMAVPLAP